MTGTSGIGCLAPPMCLRSLCQYCIFCFMLVDLHVHCYTHCAQVADTHYTADNISTKIVKDQDFPDRVAISVENGRNRSKKTVGMRLVSFGGFDGLVQVEDFLEGR